MSEFVQQSICQIQAELEDLNFSKQEKREIMKRRTRYEYRLRKRTKDEKDCLQYIAYEKGLLKLVRERKRAGQNKTKNRPEVPIILRIHQLYQLSEKWFPKSLSTWLDHIEFSKQQKEHSRVGRLYDEMLRKNNSEPELWLKAATWQLERNNMESARTLMQRCISFNWNSVWAWVEKYRLELQISKMLRGKREDIDESDPNLNGAAAEVVCKHACQKFPDNIDLWLSMIKVCDGFNFAQSQRVEMMKQLKEQFSSSPHMWDFLARRRLPRNKTKMPNMPQWKEDNFFATFEEGVKRIPSNEMWTLYLEACLELITLPKADDNRVRQRVEKTLAAFQKAYDADCLSVDMFVAWMYLLKDVQQLEEAGRVCELMTQRHPTHPLTWTQRLLLHVQALAPAPQVLACLDRAISAVPISESWCVWEPALQYLMDADDCDKDQFQALLERACNSPTKELCIPAKVFYMRWAILNKSRKKLRELYKRLYILKPQSVEFYMVYINYELTQDKVNMERVRGAFDDATLDLGASEPDLWLQYLEMELKSPYGDPSKGEEIHRRATVDLHEGPLRDSYLKSYHYRSVISGW